MGIWVERTAEQREIAAVSEKHLLIARNLTHALERYADDTKAVFEHFVASVELQSPSEANLALAGKIGFRHFCIVNPSGQAIRNWPIGDDGKSGLPPNISEAIPPRGHESPAFSTVLMDGAGEATLYLMQRLASGNAAIAALDLAYIRKVQKSIAFGKKGHSVVVDRKGNVIAHPREDWERQAKNIAAVAPVTAMIAGKTGVTTFLAPAFNKEMISGYTTVPGTGWGVMVPQPLEKLLARADQVRQIVIGLILIGLMAAGLIGWFLSGLLVGPVAAAVRAAREFASGNMVVRVPAYPSGVPVEYRELGSAFNAMAQEVASDFNERRRVEEALRLSEARLSSIINNSPSPISLKDNEQRFVLVNKAFEKTFSARNEDVIGKRVADIVGAELARKVDDMERRALESGAAQFEERSATLPSGKTFDHFVIKFPISDSDGAIVGIGTIATDVRRLRNAEGALQESQSQLRLIIDSLPVLIAYIDENMRFVIVNKTGAEWYKQPVEDIVGKTPKEIFGQTNVPWKPLQDKALRGEMTSYDGPVTHPDGVTRDMHALYVPDVNQDGKVRGFFVLAENVTDRKQMEYRLQQSQKMEALGKVAGGVAHEFNNMLMAITGNLELLIEEELRDMPDAAAQVKLVLNTAFRGKDLTSRLLSYTGNPFVSPKTVDIGGNIRDTALLLQPVLGESVSIETVIPSELWPVHIDVREFESALTNLAINSRDAMPDGGSIEISASNIELDAAFAMSRPYSVKPGEYVRIRVSDTGTGMPVGVADCAFDPFFTTKKFGQGTGLGLSMVYGFVHRQSGGYVDIETAEGKGTSVSLYFPRSPGVADAGLSDDRAQPPVRNRSVLLVEDDPDVLNLLAAVLEAASYTVHRAADGAAAMAILDSEIGIDLMLSDVVLTGTISGIDLAAYVEATRRGAKIILISGYAKEELFEKGVPDGRYVLVSKPVRNFELLEIIDGAFAEASAA